MTLVGYQQKVWNICLNIFWAYLYPFSFYLQEDLSDNDVVEILDDLAAGKKPKAGPR